MPVPYVQCLVCGRVTPVDRGICYHCGAPLPSQIVLPRGLVVCPNCLRVTGVETGYCRHCKYRLPEEVVAAAGGAPASRVPLAPRLGAHGPVVRIGPFRPG